MSNDMTLVVVGVIVLGLYAYQMIKGKQESFRLLQIEPKDDNWALNTGRLFTLIMGLIALGAVVFVGDYFRAIFYGVAIAFVLPLSKKAEDGIVLFGSVQKAGIGLFAGIASWMVIVFMFTTFFHSSAIIAIKPLEILGNVNYLFTGISAPIVEELLFRSFLFFTLMALLRKFAFTGRLMQRFPTESFVLVALLVSLGFAAFHIPAYKDDVTTLATLELLSFVWIVGVQLTGTIAFAMGAHIMNNFTALGATPIDVILYILVPLVIAYFAQDFIKKKLLR